MPLAAALLALLVPTADASRPLAWPDGPLDVRVALPTPAGDDLPRALVGQSIPYFDPAKPAGEPLGQLRIAGAALEDDGRTLHLATDPHPRQASFRLTLPGMSQPLRYDLHGVAAEWDAEPADPAAHWSLWLPALDADRLRALANHSAPHARALATLGKPGTLSLRTLLTLPDANTTVELDANRPLQASLGAGALAEAAGDQAHATLEAEPGGGPLELWVTVETGGDAPAVFRAARRDAGADKARPIPADRQLLPWVPPAVTSNAAPAAAPYDLAGGDPDRGRQVFTGAEAKCSACHKVDGEGGEVGPALDKLAGRDRAEVYRSIAEPSAEIAPEYLPYTVATAEGQVVVGVVRAVDLDSIRVLDTNAQAVTIPKAKIEELRASATSIMPVGLAGALGEQKMRDVIAFLTARKN